jgi:hypothetical protein
MTTDIKPIETHYAGCRFRSRLEARWAVFFDTHGIKWEYEAQGFDLPIVGRYLPDFWLPEWKSAVEIKGEPLFPEVDMDKFNACRKLAVLSIVKQRPSFLFSGNIGPDHLAYMWDNAIYALAPCRWGRCHKCNRVTLFHIWSFGRQNCIKCNAEPRAGHWLDDSIYTEARSARFEFGETPIPKRLRERAGRR